MIFDSVSAFRDLVPSIFLTSLLDQTGQEHATIWNSIPAKNQSTSQHFQVESVTFDLGTWGKINIKFCSSILQCLTQSSKLQTSTLLVRVEHSSLHQHSCLLINIALDHGFLRKMNFESSIQLLSYQRRTNPAKNQSRSQHST